MTAILADEAARIDARSTLAQSLLVEAGAGTGKTTLIVERIANLVDAGVPIERIVAITFTEKAAGELKLRVRRSLERRASDPDLDPPARARARAALAALERSSISTIHAWCARLLREHPVEARVDPLFRVLDGNASDDLFSRVWENWLARELSGTHPVPIAEIGLFTADEWVRELASLADLLVRHRVELPGALPPLAPAGCDPVADAEAALAALDPKTLGSACSDPDDTMMAVLGRIAFRRTEFLRALPAVRREILLREENLGSTGYSTKGNAKNWGGKGATALAAARAALTSAQEAWQTARAVIANDLCARVSRWLALGEHSFVRAYEDEKRAQGLLDFDDLLVRARDLLAQHPGVRRRVRRGMRLIVDEFQDTDPVQCEAIFHLATDPGSLFLVGDPKQSIYAFRGADVETYARARDQLSTGGNLREISTNFRSREAILSWVNSVFSTMLVANPDEPWRIGYRALHVHHAVNGVGSGVHILRAPAGASFEMLAESRDAEARTVAAMLLERVHSKWTVRDPKTGADRPARWSDVVLLLRNRKTSLWAYERAFRAAQIPTVVVGGRALWARAEVRALTSLCRAIENPHDEVSVVASLKSPFFGASDADLLLWKHAQGGFAAEHRPKQDGSLVSQALTHLSRWHELRLEIPVANLLESILSEAGAVASFGIKPDGAQRVANLLRLVDTARAGIAPPAGDATPPPVSFRAWVSWLSERRRDLREDAEGAVLEEDADAVRVMTMHAAKGLEFPVVVLGDLAYRDPRGSERDFFDRATRKLAFRISARDVSLETSNFDSAKASTGARQDAEELRLLYVASTRARDALIVPLFHAGTPPRSFFRTLTTSFPTLLEKPLGSLLEAGEGGPAQIVDGALVPITAEPPVFKLPADALAAAVEALGPPPVAGIRGAEPLGGEPTGAARPGAARREGEAGVRGEAPEREGEDEDADERTLRERLASRMRSRRVRPVTWVVNADAPTVAYAPPNTGLLPEEAALLGTVVHAALEHADLGDPDDLERAARLQARARMLTPAATDRAALLARNAARLPSLVRARTAARLMREWPFELPIDGGMWTGGDWLLEGIVDLAWVENDGLVILDWKTDALPPGDEAAIAGAAEHHRPQLLAYAWAVSRITGIAPRSTVVALLDAGREVERRITPEEMAETARRVEAAFHSG